MAATSGSRLGFPLIPILISFTALAAGMSDAAGRSGAPEPGQEAAPGDSPEEFRRLVDAGRYPEAETLARRVVKEAEASYGPESLQAAEAMDCLGDTLLQDVSWIVPPAKWARACKMVNRDSTCGSRASTGRYQSCAPSAPPTARPRGFLCCAEDLTSSTSDVTSWSSWPSSSLGGASACHWARAGPCS